ncbi:MAG: hypothetical protein RH860_10825 [Cytophagales bacterium]
MINKFIFPLLISIYFSIAIVFRHNEIFPFFSFKLYSRVPQNFEHFDILIGQNKLDNENYLLLDNKSLNKIELFYYRNLLASFKNSDVKFWQPQIDQLIYHLGLKQPLYLVKLEGDVIEFAQKRKYKRTVLKQIAF